jgi:PBP1b-binding outer membrane lipoprotein LpoB
MMRIVISLFLICLLLTACSKKEGYRYLGDTEPNQQTVPQDEPDGQE